MHIRLSGTAINAMVVFSLFYAGPCFAQSFKVRDQVEASPLSMNSKWEFCEVTQVLPGGDYGVACGPRRTDYVVPRKWVRALTAPFPAQAQGPAPAPAKGPAQSAPASPAKGAVQVSEGGALARGRYECWAAAGVAGTLNLEIKGDTTYAGNGKAGDLTYDPQTGKISFQSGPWAGFYGKRLGSGKIGISSRPGGSYNTSCDLK